MAIAICAGEARIWLKQDDGNYLGPKRDFELHSGLQSYSIQFIDAAPAQPEWVEIQTYILLEKDEDHAAIQWSRAVNNRGLAASDTNRTILEYGSGTLHRTRKTCSNPPLAPL